MTTEQNLTLGEFLRQERERHGVTIEQVASATKINVRVLHSLESDQYAELPAKPFIRGFVSSYARFIGLDPNEVLMRFDDFIDAKVLNRPVRETNYSGYAFEKRETEQSRTVLWIVMGGFVILGGLMLVVLKPSLKHHKQTHAEKLRAIHAKASPSPSALPHVMIPPSPTPTLPGPLVTLLPKPSPSPLPSPQESRKPDPLRSGADLKPNEIHHKVVIKAQGGDIWVRYRVDEKPMMKFILRQDRILVLRAKERIRFQTSNPKLVTYSYNNTGMRPLTGDKNLTITQGGPTLLFPAQGPETTQEPFPGEKPLPNPPPAPQRGASPSPTPTT